MATILLFGNTGVKMTDEEREEYEHQVELMEKRIVSLEVALREALEQGEAMYDEIPAFHGSQVGREFWASLVRVRQALEQLKG